MPSQALYRKWRSRTFEDIVAQEHVTHTLANALRSGRIAHAYLFAGPRGTGKTSTARLLAKAVNCRGPETEPRPCNRCAICLAVDEGRLMDLIEIDAASNRGIDEIRALREKVNFRPTEARFKVYVIDEVHMLTNEAFNALLKTLEEPPGHVIFVLATTEPHKIPATVLSRCQRFDFRRIPLAAIVQRLQYIAAEEGIGVDPGVLELIARQSTGSLRDAISLLDQLVSYGNQQVSLEQAQQVLGLAPHQVVQRLVQCLTGGDTAGGLTAISEAVDSGADVAQISRELVEYLRGLLLTRMAGTASLVNAPDEVREAMKREAELADLPRLVGWIKTFNQAILDMRTGTYPQLLLELAWLTALMDTQIGLPSHATQLASPGERLTEQRPGFATTSRQNTGVQLESIAALPGKEAVRSPTADQPSGSPAEAKPVEGATPAEVSLEDIQAKWATILAELQREHHSSSYRTIHALLERCQPIALNGDELVLGFQHDVLAEKLADPARAAIAQQALEQSLGVRLRIKCRVVSADSVSEQAGSVSLKFSGAKSAPSNKQETSEHRDDATQLAMATEEVVTEDNGGSPPQPSCQDRYAAIVAGDRLIKEVIQKYGAIIEGIDFIEDEPEEE